MRPIYRCRDGRFTEDPGRCQGAELFIDAVRRVELSKLMSGLLRHFPWEAGLVLDEEGWVRVEDLAEAIRTRWRNREKYEWVSPEHIVAVAMLDPKGRFELKEGRIRARYGHSIRVRIRYPEDRESRILYHGTTLEAYSRIRSEGIKKGRRMWVHLSTSPRMAVETASRHGRRIIVLVVDAACLRERGIHVYSATEQVKLAEYVPPECIAGVLNPQPGSQP